MCHSHNARKDNQLLSELGWTLKRSPEAPRMGFVVPESKVHPTWVEWLPYMRGTQAAQIA